METWIFVLLFIMLLGTAIAIGLLVWDCWRESIFAAAFLFVLMLAALGGAVWLTYDFIDDRAGTETCANGQVTGRYVTAAYTSMVWTGKFAVPVYHPEEPHVQFLIPGWKLDYNIGWSWFNRLDAGMKVRLCYRNGYFRKQPRSLTHLNLLTVER